MQFWASGAAVSVLILMTLMACAGLLRRVFPVLVTIGVPTTIVAGLMGFVAGPSVLGWLPLDIPTLEAMVYHGLALTFIAVGLQPVSGGEGGGPNAVSMGFGIGVSAVLQGLLGLLIVLLLNHLGGHHHPGLGLLLPLAFNQGPGQALSMGRAWEATGFADGGQLGLIFAALGFLWCGLVGVPLVMYGRRHGWFEPSEEADHSADEHSSAEPVAANGALEPMAIHLAAIGVVYLITYELVAVLAGLLQGKPQLQAMVWGFHFLVAMGVALTVRGLLPKVVGAHVLKRQELNSIASSVVDVTCVAALSAIQLSVFQSSWGEVLLITSVGGLVTVVTCLWLGSRAFTKARFEQAIYFFGTATGTLPTGLALVRILDPQLKGPTATSAVVGSAVAAVLGVPLMIVVLPLATQAWPDGYPAAGWKVVGGLALYLVFLLVLWSRFGALRWSKPLWHLWARKREG